MYGNRIPPKKLSLVDHEHLRPPLQLQLAKYRQLIGDRSQRESDRVVSQHKAAVLFRLLDSPSSEIDVEDTKFLVAAELGSSFNSETFQKAVETIDGSLHAVAERSGL